VRGILVLQAQKVDFAIALFVDIDKESHPCAPPHLPRLNGALRCELHEILQWAKVFQRESRLDHFVLTASIFGIILCFTG
jgi:hypothetical protein